MSDIENDLFNNSDEDGSDEESVAESEVDYDEEVPDVAKPKLIIGDDVVDRDVEEDADEDVEYGAGSEDEVSLGEGEENDEDAEDGDAEAVVGAAAAAGAGTAFAASNRPTLESDNDDGEGDDEGDEDDDEDYLQKFDRDIKKNYIVDYHPECMIHNYEEISALTKVVRDKDNMIVDPLHRTIPYLTKYERARVLGQRAKQINLGARPFVKVPENIIDGHLVAEMELMQKRIPFIIRRPLPGNSGSEYWNLKDLEIITF